MRHVVRRLRPRCRPETWQRGMLEREGISLPLALGPGPPTDSVRQSGRRRRFGGVWRRLPPRTAGADGGGPVVRAQRRWR